MKRVLKTLILLCAFACSNAAQAQVKKLSEIKENTPYLLRCVNDYGYCVYNPNIDEKNPTLGEALVDHPEGCANDEYRTPIDPKNKNNQWYFIMDPSGDYYLQNVGSGSYITNRTESSWGGWGGWGGWGTTYEYGTWFFTEEMISVSIESNGDGVWTFRPRTAADSNTSTAFLCAASHSSAPMAGWMASDAGSSWEILTVEDDVKLYHNGSGTNGEVRPEDEGTLGEVIPEGDTRYFCFLDSQVIAIPEQFILDRVEDEQFITLTLQGDTTITLSKFALETETTEAPGELPVIESFKFNNKFNDQLYTDAAGVIDNSNDSIYVQASSISKTLVASIKLPQEEDDLGTKVWVDGIRNISKETRRHFGNDITYTVARPRQYIYKVFKTSNDIWSTKPEDNEDQWIYSPINLTAEMLSTNWPSANSNEQLSNLLDGNTSSYFHSNYSSTNNWSSGSYYGDGTTTYPYLQIAPAEELENFRFTYTTRDWSNNGGYAPQGFIISCSQDGENWQDITTLSKDVLPTGQLVTYTSPIIQMGQKAKYIRLQLTDSTRKNYLVLSEFSMEKVESNPNYGKDPEEWEPELLVPAQYEARFLPLGRDYKVHVDFPANITTSEYNVPRIDILFGDSVSWGSNMWIGRYGKTYFEDASITIDGAGIYPDMPKTHLLVRGRGNSSWSNSSSSKNPYRLKFDSSVKPFGMTKGKSWVLLANKQSNSMTTNALAMKIADIVESDGCNHCIPVELYVNGQYRGSYNFTEKVGFSNNSIDLDDETNAAMLELDSYYDEAYKFRDQYYNEYVNVKEPDLDDPERTSVVTFQQIQNSFNNFTYCVKNNNYAALTESSPLDVNSFVRAMLVTDLTRNTELQHPKSWYVYSEDAVYGHSPWHFGPVWDFDWSYGYEGHGQYFISDAETDLFNYGNVGTPFFKQLLRGSEVVKKEYYRLWTHFIQKGYVDELINYCDDYFAFVEPSFQHNASKWSDGNSYSKITSNSKSWLKKRANYIYRNLDVYDLGNDIIDEPEEFVGQPDGQLEADRPTVIINMAVLDKPMSVYNLNGQKVASLRPSEVNGSNLYPGIYIINGKKVAIK